MIPLPSLIAAFVDKQDKIKAPWNFYLQQFTQAPPEMLDLVLSGSPFEYTAVEPGVISATEGTITGITLTRGTITINVTGAKLIPVSINDVVEITYSVLPAIRFIPSYGQRTG